MEDNDMPRKKKGTGQFSLKTKATESLDEQMRKHLATDFKDRPLKDIFDMYSERPEETEEEKKARERAEDEREVDAIDEADQMKKDNDERTRWY